MLDALREAYLALDPATLTRFLWCALALAVGMLIWDTVEVGRNDAANLVNAVYGARILPRHLAVWVAGVGVVVGACLSENVIETARKGIFEPGQLDAMQDPLRAALAIYISVYIVDTVTLYGYSAFGMPVSTTACLVFELLGASFALKGAGIVKWEKAGTVVFAIVCSILISAIAGFLIQRVVRGAIRERGHRLTTLLLHGGWAGGGLLTMLFYFMVVKGMSKVEIVQDLNRTLIEPYGAAPFMFVTWGLFAILIHGTLVIFRNRAAKLLFPVLAIIGTLCMGFAFGQNDLANCASPGLSAYTLIANREETLSVASQVPIPWWMLLGCGALLLAGMTTRNAARVTVAAAGAGSMSHTVALYAPGWCLRIARFLLKGRDRGGSLAPPPVMPDTGEVRDYDAVRACVILGVSASVIATASSFGLPVSTTYVAFAAVVTTGAADRILQRGDADLKLARTIWVIFSWFAAAVIAAVATALVCRFIFWLGIGGMVAAVAVNLALRRFFRRRGDAQERRVQEDARERAFPEDYTEDDG